MQLDAQTFRKLLSEDLTEAVIRLGLIAFIVVMSVRVFAPFAGVMLWALILAVALYPLYLRMVEWTGGRQGRAATLLVVLALLIVGVPTVMLGSSFAGHIHGWYTAFENHQIAIPQPPASVAGWPLVGEQLHTAWSAAADNLPAFLQELQPQLAAAAKYLLATAASTAGGVFSFLGSLIIAGVMMAYGQSGNQSMQRIFSRLAGAKSGPQLHKLSTATIRSVATGVIGVAFIQALLLGIGFVIADVPAAPVLAMIVLLIGIMQLPATIVTLPVIAYLWMAGDASTAANIFYSIYLIVAGLADNVLKPVLLGRGVEVPMPVILLGALGGMVANGMIGLFVGAVLLAVGYEVFMRWVDAADGGAEAPLPAEPTGSAPD